MARFHGKNAVTTLTFDVKESNLPPEITSALQQVCAMWRTNNRLLRLVRQKHIPRNKIRGQNPLEYVTEMSSSFCFENNERIINIDFKIVAEGLLPKEFVRKLRNALYATVFVLVNEPSRTASTIFFQRWRA